MAGIAIILVIGIYIMWKSIFRVKPKRKANSDKNTAVKLSDITLHKASAPIRKVDEGSACETYENSKTVAARSDVHESHEFTVTNNEGSNSETEIDAKNMQEKDSIIPLGSSKIIDEPLVQEQFEKGAAASTSTVTSSYSFIFSGKTMIHSDINKSNELPQAKSDTNVKTQKLNLSVLTGEDSIDFLKSLKTISSDNSDTKSASSPTNTITTITGSTNITTSLTFHIPDPSRFGSLKIIQSETFASAAQSFAQTVVSTMTAKLQSASVSSGAFSKLNEPVNAWTYVQPDKMPLISIDGVYIKDIRPKNLMPTVEDKKKKSAPIFGAKDKALEPYEVGVNDIPVVAQSLKEPAVTPLQDPPIMFKFTAQNSTATPQSGAAIITSSSNIPATANTKSAGFKFNAPQLDGLTSYRNKPTTASTSCYLQSSHLGENKSKPALCLAPSASNLRQNKSKLVFSHDTLTLSVRQNKPTAAFSFTTPTPSLGQNKSTPAFSFATPTPSLGQNKSMAAFSFATPTPSLGQNKSTPAFSFATPTSSLEQSKPISVFGSATPASSTDFKLPESVPVVTSELKFGGRVSETVSNEKLRGNTLNPSPTITSSCNTPPMLNFTYRGAPTSTKETSYFFPHQRKIARGLRRHECYSFFKRS